MIRAARGVVLVRKAETEETLPGGKIVIPDDARAKLASYQVEIVDVGPPEICENDACQRDHDPTRRHFIPESVKPGAWAIVRPRSFIQASAVDHGLLFVKIDDVFAVFTQTEEPPKD